MHSTKQPPGCACVGQFVVQAHAGAGGCLVVALANNMPHTAASMKKLIRPQPPTMPYQFTLCAALLQQAGRCYLRKGCT
jgi:hypothetical protein